MPFLDYAALRAAVPVRSVLALLAFEPSSMRGMQWRGACPLPGHDSSRTGRNTFSVNVQHDLFNCHACKIGGDQLNLWATVHECTTYEAALDLCRRLNLDVGDFVKSATRKPQ
jgi:hypothetical protein